MAEKVTPKTTKTTVAKTTTKAAPKTATKKATTTTATKKPVAKTTVAKTAPKKVEVKTVEVKTQPVKVEAKPAQSFTPVVNCSTTRYKGIAAVILGALVFGFMFLTVIVLMGKLNLIQFTEFSFRLTTLPYVSSEFTTLTFMMLASSILLILSVVTGLLMIGFGIPGILNWKKANKANFILSIIGLTLSLLAIVIIIVASTIAEGIVLGIAPILIAICFSAYLIANVAFKLIAKR